MLYRGGKELVFTQLLVEAEVLLYAGPEPSEGIGG